ncbi:MAG: hypothetical protein U1E65_08925 [Myxococcota bacterium]
MFDFLKNPHRQYFADQSNWKGAYEAKYNDEKLAAIITNAAGPTAGAVVLTAAEHGYVSIKGLLAFADNMDLGAAISRERKVHEGAASASNAARAVAQLLIDKANDEFAQANPGAAKALKRAAG